MTDRRGNGLLADAYVPLCTLPSSRADLMLDALRRSGIAAYAIPAGKLEPGEDTPEDAPTDHLYVDAQERVSAERILREELPDLGGADSTVDTQTGSLEGTDTLPRADSTDDDDVWADLVARFYENEDGANQADWPDAENLGSDRTFEPGETEETTAHDNDATTGGKTEGRVVRPAATGGETENADQGDHYIPPPPPPFPRGDLTSRLSWGALFSGPLLLVGSMLLGYRLPGWLAFCAVAAFIAGFVVLVVRMGDHPSGGDGPDGGAVV